MDYSVVGDAAFGRRPGVSVPGVGRTDPAVRWAAAVALGGQGRLAAATALLDGLGRDPRTPPEIRAHALVTRASHLRQWGGHAAAERLDGAAAALAVGLLRGRAGNPAVAAGNAGGNRLDDHPRGSVRPERGGVAEGRTAIGAEVHGLPVAAAADARSAVVDALVGLAADALGQGAAGRAETLLNRADALIPDHRSGYRPGLRLRWVRAELALVRGDLRTAADAADEAVAAAVALGSVRHLVKSRLLAAVVAALVDRAGSEPGSGSSGPRVAGVPGVGPGAPPPADRDRGRADPLALLDALAAEAAAAGLLPLSWAAWTAAADLTPAPAVPPGPGPRPVEPGPPRRVIDTGGGRQPPSGGTGLPPDRPNGSGTPHDRRPEWLLRSTNGAPNDAARRRHAATATLSVIRARSEARGRRLMGGVARR